MTITDTKKPIAVNVVGHAEEAADPAERDRYLQKISEISSRTLKDYAPILKLHQGGLKVFRFTPRHAKYNDFTKRFSDAKEELKDY